MLEAFFSSTLRLRELREGFSPEFGEDAHCYHIEFKTRAFSKSNLARPNICLLIYLSLFTCPSVCPFIRAVDYT
jgi:hypothetical protein